MPRFGISRLRAIAPLLIHDLVPPDGTANTTALFLIRQLSQTKDPQAEAQRIKAAKFLSQNNAGSVTNIRNLILCLCEESVLLDEAFFLF